MKTSPSMAVLAASIAIALVTAGCATENEEDRASLASEVTTLYVLPLEGTEQARTTENLNMRTGPSADHEVKLVIPAGATVTYGQRAGTHAKNGYWPVYYREIGGWVYGAYLESTTSGKPPGSALGGEQPSGSVYDSGCAALSNAAYCGGNFGVQGSSEVLYRCENGYRTYLEECKNGCVAYTWVGSPDDHCR